MSGTARHVIPRRLDDPERWLFWTMDEAAALMGPAVLGLAANHFVAGLVAGVAGWLLLRRVKRGGGANIAHYALYWFSCPTSRSGSAPCRRATSAPRAQTLDPWCSRNACAANPAAHLRMVLDGRKVPCAQSVGRIALFGRFGHGTNIANSAYSGEADHHSPAQRDRPWPARSEHHAEPAHAVPTVRRCGVRTRRDLNG